MRVYDVIRMLSRDGRATPLGDAIAHQGRIARTLRVLRLADEPGYRGQIKAQANLQEDRHSPAREISHGENGQLHQRYQDCVEDRIGALGLVLDALVFFNTRYMDAAVNQLRVDGFDVRDEDIARLSPFVRHHINVLGRYSFQLPDSPRGLRPLRDPDSADGRQARVRAGVDVLPGLKSRDSGPGRLTLPGASCFNALCGHVCPSYRHSTGV